MAIFTAPSKPSTTYTADSRNVAAFTAQQQPSYPVLAAAGLAMGPLGCTYSGGQIITGSTTTSWTALTKS